MGGSSAASLSFPAPQDGGCERPIAAQPTAGYQGHQVPSGPQGESGSQNICHDVRREPTKSTALKNVLRGFEGVQACVLCRKKKKKMSADETNVSVKQRHVRPVLWRLRRTYDYKKEHRRCSAFTNLLSSVWAQATRKQPP